MALLRRRRCPLCLLIGYMFALNLMVATAMEARQAAVAPLLVAVELSNCTPDGAAAQDVERNGAPAGTPACPSCDKLCPIGGCAPVGPVAIAAIPLPRVDRSIQLQQPRFAVWRAGAALHPSDISAQAPPLCVGSRFKRVATQA